MHRDRHHLGPADDRGDGTELAARCSQKLSGADLSNAAFPFGTSKEIEIGYARVRACRITYVGELGWELYIPTEFAAHVFERLIAAGAEFGLTPAGMHTMNNCRMEKAYRHWGHDIARRGYAGRGGPGLCGCLGQERRLHRQGGAGEAASATVQPKRMVCLALEDSIRGTRR